MTDSCTQRTIQFSPPDITEAEIKAVADALRSGWITTGPKTKELEEKLCAVTHADGLACVSSATTALEIALRILGIGPGDEVITSAYTYTASASCIAHTGATIVLCDTLPGGYEMDYSSLPELITEKTKAIIPVDIAGRMCDYDRLRNMLIMMKGLYTPSTPYQKAFDRIPIIADAAHSLGASYHGKPSGSVADFTCFSFHAVKNFTTAEGGALAWKHVSTAPERPAIFMQGPGAEAPTGNFDDAAYYKEVMLQSLHGQSKDALAKNQAGSWEYDIIFPGYKCNMTDIQAALGLVQLERYPALLKRRYEIIERYERGLDELPVSYLKHVGNWAESSGHLMLVRINGAQEAYRNRVIELMASYGIATNVHYKPLPLLTAYKNLGFDIANYQNAYHQYENEITLPLHTLLSDDDVDYVIDCFARALKQADEENIPRTITTRERNDKRLQAYVDRMDKEGGWKDPAAFRGFEED